MKWPIFVVGVLCSSLAHGQTDRQGNYFAKKSYQPSPLPGYEAVRDLLPSPVFDENPLLVETYWKAWELASRHFHEPAPGSGYVSQFIDAAFNKNIFLWDTAFMSMFCNTAYGLVPGIASLDNFYAKQHDTGEICREIDRTSGKDFEPWVNAEGKPLYSSWGFNTDEHPVTIRFRGRELPEPPPRLTLDALDNPVPAWAELESYRYTGDSARLALVREPLVHYYLALQKYLRQGNGLYVTDWASMDNSPRNPYLLSGGMGVDISAQMAMFARNLASIDSILGKTDQAARWNQEADSLSALINALLWDGERGFYFDRAPNDSLIHIKTIAAFWTLLGGVASRAQAEKLVAELRNPATFGRMHPVPSCAADESGYERLGGYWRGAVWPSTNTMVIRGLEQYGYNDLAREIALKHLTAVSDVEKETGTIWENYAPDVIAPGRHVDGALVVRDMVGWSGIGPILYFLEYGIGFTPDAPHNTLHWTIRSDQRSGCERYRFNRHVVSLVATPGPGGRTAAIAVNADAPFTLTVRYHNADTTVTLGSGASQFTVGRTTNGE